MNTGCNHKHIASGDAMIERTFPGYLAQHGPAESGTIREVCMECGFFVRIVAASQEAVSTPFVPLGRGIRGRGKGTHSLNFTRQAPIRGDGFEIVEFVEAELDEAAS